MQTIEPTDDSLLARVACGDAEALGALYDRYNRLAISVAYRVLGEHGASEDTVQEAFLAVWRRVDSFDSARGTVRSWLLTIVRNGAVDRRRGRHGRALRDTALVDVAFSLATDAEETFNAVAATVDAECVRAALDSLPGEQREAIELAYFGGLTHQEIAARTDTPLGTIKGRMRLGLNKLRQQFDDMMPPEAGAFRVSVNEPSAAASRDIRQPGPLALWANARSRIRSAWRIGQNGETERTQVNVAGVSLWQRLLPGS